MIEIITGGFYEIKKYSRGTDAILESPYVVQEPQTKKGHWTEVLRKNSPFI